MPKANISKHWCSIWAPSTIHNILSLPPPSSSPNNTHNMPLSDGNDTQHHHPLSSSYWHTFQVPHHWQWCGDQMMNDEFESVICHCWLVSTQCLTHQQTTRQHNHDRWQCRHHITMTTSDDNRTWWDTQCQPQSMTIQMMTNAPKQAWTDAHMPEAAATTTKTTSFC